MSFALRHPNASSVWYDPEEGSDGVYPSSPVMGDSHGQRSKWFRGGIARVVAFIVTMNVIVAFGGYHIVKCRDAALPVEEGQPRALGAAVALEAPMGDEEAGAPAPISEPRGGPAPEAPKGVAIVDSPKPPPAQTEAEAAARAVALALPSATAPPKAAEGVPEPGSPERPEEVSSLDIEPPTLTCQGQAPKEGEYWKYDAFVAPAPGLPMQQRHWWVRLSAATTTLGEANATGRLVPDDLLDFSNWGLQSPPRKSASDQARYEIMRERYCAVAGVQSIWEVIDRGATIVPPSPTDNPAGSGTDSSSQWLRLQKTDEESTTVFVMDLGDRLTMDVSPDGPTMDAIAEAIGLHARHYDAMILIGGVHKEGQETYTLQYFSLQSPALPGLRGGSALLESKAGSLWGLVHKVQGVRRKNCEE